jgi:hypothetical protein
MTLTLELFPEICSVVQHAHQKGKVLTNHAAWVSWVVFTPDGKRLASAAADLYPPLGCRKLAGNGSAARSPR